MTVSHHQPPAVLVALTDVRIDVRGDLRLQRRRKHPTRPLPHDLIDRRLARHRNGWRDPGVGNYREHGRTLPTRVGARALLDSWIRTRREGIPPDAHPQDSSIALGRFRWEAAQYRAPVMSCSWAQVKSCRCPGAASEVQIGSPSGRMSAWMF